MSAFELLTCVFSDASVRRILDLIPLPSLKRLLRISDIVRESSSRIIEERKAALRKGDDALRQEVGEGKDIISVCRTSLSLCAEPPLMT